MNAQSPSGKSVGQNTIWKVIGGGGGTVQVRYNKKQKPEPIYHLKLRKEPETFVVLPKLCNCYTNGKGGTHGELKLVDTAQAYRTIIWDVLKIRFN